MKAVRPPKGFISCVTVGEPASRSHSWGKPARPLAASPTHCTHHLRALALASRLAVRPQRGFLAMGTLTKTGGIVESAKSGLGGFHQGGTLQS